MTAKDTAPTVRTSLLMEEFLRRLEREIERRHKRRLTQNELRSEVFRAASYVCAKMVMEQKPPKPAGKANGDEQG